MHQLRTNDGGDERHRRTSRRLSPCLPVAALLFSRLFSVAAAAFAPPPVAPRTSYRRVAGIVTPSRGGEACVTVASIPGRPDRRSPRGGRRFRSPFGERRSVDDGDIVGCDGSAVASAPSKLFAVAVRAFASLLLGRVFIGTPSRALASSATPVAGDAVVGGGSSSALQAATAAVRRSLGALRSPSLSAGAAALASRAKSWPTSKNLKTVAAIVVAVWAVASTMESIAARRRQSVDATSEWGRYADKPAARGQALMVLLMRLVPFVAAPAILEFLHKRKGRTDAGGEGDGGASKSGGGTIAKDQLEGLGSPRARRLREEGGSLFAEGLLRLGPLYIKIGQILSCQENLFPEEWIAGLERLQDRVPAKSGKDALRLALDAFPGDERNFYRTFSEFDDVPLAAASLGQVHRARLRSNGEAVAIKVQRSRLQEIYDKDLTFMKKIATVVDRFGGAAGKVGGVQQSWTEIFDDAKVILYREINYVAEAENAVRFANGFGLGKGGTPSDASTAKALDETALPNAAEWMRTPFVYENLCSEKILVMEYVPSIKVSDDAKLDAAGVTIEEREYLAESLARAYLRQFCTNKFFSTDPHPGNLGVEVFDDDGSGNRPPRLVFYDFGQACSLSGDQAGGILDVIESIVDADAEKSVKAFRRMGVLVDGADMDKVQKKVQSNYDVGKLKVKKRKKSKYGMNNTVRQPEKEQPLSSAKDGDVWADDGTSSNAADSTPTTTKTTTSSTGGEVKDSEVMEFFILQSEYAFVARALSQLDGVGKGLDPDFDFISGAAPYLVEVKGAGKYVVDEMKKKLTFIYDPETGALAREMALFKRFGFNPELYIKGRNEKKKQGRNKNRTKRRGIGR